MTQRMLLIRSPYFLTEPQLQTESWEALFGRRAPLALEVGCGIGDFIVQQARQRPDWNFIAIDIFNKGCKKTVQRVEQEGLTNVRILRMEARYLLTHYLQREGLQAVYINCPDPWPKKRHRKRRLVNTELLDVLLYYLTPGGEFCFSTDFVDYGEEVGDQVLQHPGYGHLRPAPYTHDLTGYPVSKYMRRFLDLGQPIYLVHARKKNNPALTPAERPWYDQGFRLRWEVPATSSPKNNKTLLQNC